MRIPLSTRNADKLQEVRQVFEGSGIEVVGLDDIGVEGQALESGTTLRDNALKKAMYPYFCKGERIWCMADDTGLSIDVLGGEPGVRAARWAGDDATTEQVMRYTLQRMEHATNRSATFRTAAVLVSPYSGPTYFDGTLRGIILTSPRAGSRPNMPYDPIFVPDGYRSALSEMSAEQVSRISHRGLAFQRLRNYLVQVMSLGEPTTSRRYV